MLVQWFGFFAILLVYFCEAVLSYSELYSKVWHVYCRYLLILCVVVWWSGWSWWGLYGVWVVLCAVVLLYSQKTHLSCRTSPPEGHPEVTQTERSLQGHERSMLLRMPMQQTCILKKNCESTYILRVFLVSCTSNFLFHNIQTLCKYNLRGTMLANYAPWISLKGTVYSSDSLTKDVKGMPPRDWFR